MTIGPFTTYAPPGVYVQTTTEPAVGQLLGGLRVPVLIGVGQETLSQTDVEMIRGSSSFADTPIHGEDPTGRWVTGGTSINPTLGNQDGTRTQFKVRNFPIVDGEGAGKTTFEVVKVDVTINGTKVVVAAVDGTNGLVSLLVPPAEDDAVRVSYYFSRKDTRVVDDVSAQITNVSASLVAPKADTYVITAGSNDILLLTVNDVTAVSVKFTPGTRTSTDLANDINSLGVSGLSGAVHVDNQGLSHLNIVATGNVLVGTGTANGVLGFNAGQYTNRNKAFRVFNGPIVDGSNGGVTTTDPSKVVIQVNGVTVVAKSVDGANRLVTLPAAPSVGSKVTIQYYFNTFQDTFDYLPNNSVVTVGSVGISPGRRDYLNGPDFIIVNEGSQSKIQWGTAFSITSDLKTGNLAFGTTQIVGSLVDDRIYGAECARFTDPTTNVVSLTKFTMPLKATTGNGRNTPLGQSVFQTITNGRIDLPTDRPDLVTVYVGKTFRDAFAKPAAAVLEVDSSTNTFILRDPVPADYKAFATFWYSRLSDDTFTLTCLTPGASGIGKFSVSSALNNGAPVYGVRFGTKSSLPQTVQWPSGVESVTDAIHFGGTPISETVTITFNSSLQPATHASFSNAFAEPYDLFTASRIFGGVVIDGNAPVSVDLSSGFVAQLLSQPVSSPGAMTFASTDRLVLQIDGINLAPIDVSAATTLTLVATAINSAVDADAQTHADGSAAFNTTTPNALASVVTYGSESILRIRGRNLKTATNGLLSNVQVLSPTAAGQTDAAPKVRLAPNQSALGSFNAINQAAQMVGTKDEPFVITTNVNDLFMLNVDGADYSANLPAGTAVSLAAIVAYINAGYAATAPAADQATALSALVALANEIKSDYNAHRANSGGVWHTVSDVTNVVAAADASDLATAIVLLNEEKLDLNAHFANTGGAYHSVADTFNVITAPDATDLRSALILAYDLKTKYNLHRTQATVHAINDSINVTSASLADLVASSGLGFNAGQLILTSRTNTVSSLLSISQSGTANTVLGFTAGASASRVQPNAAAISGALNAAAGFNALAVAYSITSSGLGNFLRIDSRTAGASSTIAFTSVANTAFSVDTGMGITAGTSGDSGEAAIAGYSVSSSNVASGSSGTGIPGQTYTDARTGLRFTILPASAGDYANAGSFSLVVDSTFTADATIPYLAIPGVEMTVFNTLNVGASSTAKLQTYPRSGSEPQIGDVYYVSYNYAKTDLSTALFRDSKKIQQSFGPPTPDFPLSLAARLAQLNGAVILGLKQVLKAPNSAQASVGSFTAAIDEQKKPISGNVKPDVITPLGTDPQIFSYLNQHAVFMSSPRQEGERIGVVGVAAGTNALGVQSIAQGLNSEMMIVTYPDMFVVSIQDAIGNTTDQLVDGSMAAAALAGSVCNPSLDVATPLTRRQIFGFKRLGRVLDPSEANQIATRGVTIIEQVDTNMRVRHGLTTNMSSVITRTPSVTLTIQYVQQSIRSALDPFIGQKFTGSLLKAAENALTGMFSTLIDAQIVTKVAGIAAVVDEDDPTIMRTEAIYVPVFPLEYVVSSLKVRIRL